MTADATTPTSRAGVGTATSADGHQTLRTGVVIVGAGFSGLGMAIALRRDGRDDFVVLEKSADVGGTWHDNTYPGCACDIPSVLYSYSFALNPNWSRTYPTQPEIRDYLRDCVRRHGLTGHLRLGVRVDALRYDDTSRLWTVRTAAGTRYQAPVVVLGIGALHVPSYPDIPGLDGFAGPAFHSARWNHDVDLTGQRVAVIGTGASAIQFVPRIAEQASHLSVFQRTPPWILPKPDRAVRPRTRDRYRRLPVTQRLRRNLTYLLLESRAFGFTVSPKLMGLPKLVARHHLRTQVPDPRLRAQLTPRYTIGCKRVLLSNDYYPTLCRPDVELVTTPITEVRPHAVVTADGREHPADVLVYGTGFHVTDSVGKLDVTGTGGLTLADAWADGMRAYLGVTVAGFPNLYLLVGPNSGLGHNSMVFMIESQIRYVMQALRLGAERVAVRADVQDAYNDAIQRRLRRSVWQVGGCRSWYLDAHGANRTLWPGFCTGYWRRTRRLRPADYDTT